MKLLLSLIFIVAIIENAPAQLPKVGSGQLQRFENFHSSYVKPRNIDVWLPGNYSSQKKCAVLYMHDGQMLFDSATTWNKQEWKVDEVVDSLLARQVIQDVIVVGIWNVPGYRQSEYFPEKPISLLTVPTRDSLVKRELKNNPQADEYLQFIVKELKPFIDSAFSTYRDRQHTFIAGSSMGGLISLYALCEYPKVFGGAACMSTHWVGSITERNTEIPVAFQNYLRNHLPSPRRHKVYFDYGTATLDSLYEPYQLQVDEVMKSKGYDENNWVTRKFEGASHSEQAWAARLAIPFTFLLRNNLH
jgi:enterochelin esterase-like enzyme